MINYIKNDIIRRAALIVFIPFACIVAFLWCFSKSLGSFFSVFIDTAQKLDLEFIQKDFKSCWNGDYYDLTQENEDNHV